jgi:hypothetical protein
MDQITLRCPVAIKSKVTEALKAKLLKESEQNLSDIDREMQNLEFQAKRMMADQAKMDAQGLIALRAQLEEQKQRLASTKAQAMHTLEEAQKLDIGSEISRGQLEQTVVVKVGDDLDKLVGTELLLEDGKIVAIRQ